jgi:hypothetical protein
VGKKEQADLVSHLHGCRSRERCGVLLTSAP